MAWIAITALSITGAIGIYNIDAGRRSTFTALKYNIAITNAVDISRSAQADFKLQVQEWKNVLLRGHDLILYKKYWAGFEKQEIVVRNHLKKLMPIFREFGLDESMVTDAINENIKLGQKYREHIRFFVPGSLSTTFAIDKAVRGIDRKPEEHIDAIVKYIHNFQVTEMEKIRNETQNRQIISLSVSALFAVLSAIILFLVARVIINSINFPLLHTIKIFHKIGKERLSNRIILTRRDEIGDLWRALDSMQKQLLDKNNHLTQSNEELNHTLHQVRKLKEEQDGDYFLTSLLMQPLNGNYSRSKFVDVDYILEQKKKFKFRKWEKEIGGDLIVVNDIELKGKPYIVFLNADAMGKSIQGAGGALVIGSVFRSLIERTNLSTAAKNISPERWMKNAFIEIHKVFESFNGSMLISSILGLIDEKSGLLYYINAEHPHVVIYRDKTARFLDEGIMLRKLGHLGANGKITIGTFKLFPEDVLIVGSDGRDDLQLGEKDGNRVINEDEKLFLSIVEENHGDLNKIRHHLENHGSITDDLSLLRIYVNAQENIHPELQTNVKNILKELHFIENNKTLKERLAQIESGLLQEFPNHPALLRDLTWGYLKVKEYNKSFEYAKKYTDVQPEHSDYLYLASYSAKKTGNLQDAADYGERLRLRDRNLQRNLLNLADVYLLMKENNRAMKMTREVLEINPEHKVAKRVYEKLVKEAG